MGPDPIQELFREDQRLAKGAEVTVRWSEGGFDYCGRGRIVALSPGRARVALLEDAGRHGEHPAGKIIEVPRISDPGGWSLQGCVRLQRPAV